MMGSIQDKLKRVRPPRVKITYDVETGGAIEKKELPFIVGIFADLSGEPPGSKPAIKDRKMVEIDRDNYDKVMASLMPRASLAKVEEVLSGEVGKTLSGELTFQCLGDFEPLAVVKRVPVLANLYEARGRIRAIQAKGEASDAVSDLLDAVVALDDEGKKLREELVGAFPESDPQKWDPASPPAPTGETVDKLLTPPYLLQDEQDEAKRADAVAMIAQFVNDIVKPLEERITAGAYEGDPEAPPGTDLSDDCRQMSCAGFECSDFYKRRGTGGLTSSVLIDNRVAEIDCLISRQLSRIMQSPPFQKMEATWRGLNYLVFRSETGTMLKLRVLNIHKDDLLKDMQRAVEFDQSAIFKMIYEAEYGTYGGDPYSLLVGDYEFDRSPTDIELLNKLAEVAAAAHAPFISSAYSRLFDLDTFENLGKPRDLAKIFESKELIGWRSFRESEDSRYVTLALPKALLRLPYGPETVPVEGLNFCEQVDGRDAKSFLWGNSAWMLAERITNAFSLFGWTAAIRGVQGGGLVEGLPTYTFKTAEGDVEMVCPTQVTITDRREKELNDLGFMAICHCKNSNKAAFFGGQTTNLPKKYLSDAATANASLSAMLPYILCASRFAHYIKVLMREKIGSFMTRANVEAFLNDWIAQYVLLDDAATQEVKAAYPLRGAQIVVTDVPGKPGSYNATVFLKPHFQLEELTTSIRLVAELPG